MAIQENPYLPPVSRVADASIPAGPYLEAGRVVPASHGYEWIAEGWRLFRRQAGIWVLLTLVFVLIFIAASLVPFAIFLLMPVFVGGMMLGCRKLANGDELELADLFAGFQRNAGQLVLVGLIAIVLTIGAIVVVLLMFGAGASLAVFGGADAAALGAGALLTVLVSMALTLPINMAMWFAPALVALNDQKAPQAAMHSFKACLKNLVPFLIYGFILFVLAIIATIPLGLGWFVLGPVIIASVYAAYRDIFFAG